VRNHWELVFGSVHNSIPSSSLNFLLKCQDKVRFAVMSRHSIWSMFCLSKNRLKPIGIMPCRVGAWSDMLQSMGSPSCSNATRWWCSIKTWGFSRTLYPSTALLLRQTHMPHLHSKFQLLLLKWAFCGTIEHFLFYFFLMIFSLLSHLETEMG